MGRYPANKLISRNRLPERKVPKDPLLYKRDHAVAQDNPVLAAVSRGYPRLEGSSITCYSPVRRFTHSPKGAFTLDLHASSTPPTFVLSQDQTLRFEFFDLAFECPVRASPSGGPVRGT